MRRGQRRLCLLLLIFLSSFVETLFFEMCTTASKLELAIDNLIEVFTAYATGGSDPYQLDYLEFKRLIQTELSQSVKDSWDPRKVGEIMDDLDKTQDGKVSFEEFMTLVTRVTVLSRGYFKGYTPLVYHCGQIRDGRLQKM